MIKSEAPTKRQVEKEITRIQKAQQLYKKIDSYDEFCEKYLKQLYRMLKDIEEKK